MCAQKSSGNNGYTASYYSFTPQEMRYLLFGKKVCPRCGGRLHRQKAHETVYRLPGTSDEPERISRKKVKHNFYLYSCERCRAVFPLAQLAGRR